MWNDFEIWKAFVKFSGIWKGLTISGGGYLGSGRTCLFLERGYLAFGRACLFLERVLWNLEGLCYFCRGLSGIWKGFVISAGGYLGSGRTCLFLEGVI